MTIKVTLGGESGVKPFPKLMRHVHSKQIWLMHTPMSGIYIGGARANISCYYTTDLIGPWEDYNAPVTLQNS
jgi:hypothetical protein